MNVHKSGVLHKPLTLLFGKSFCSRQGFINFIPQEYVYFSVNQHIASTGRYLERETKLKKHSVKIFLLR